MIQNNLITESLPTGMFWVRLDNEDHSLDYISLKDTTEFYTDPIRG
jgi:hypothetical protein